MNDIPRKKLFILIGLLAIAILLIFFIVQSVRDSDDFQTEETFEINDLTGEITRITNANPESVGITTGLVIYGYSELDDSLSFVQRELFREQTDIYLRSVYEGSINSITIDPNSIEFIFPNDREEIIEFSLVLEENDDRIDTTIRLLGRVGLEITYKNSNPGIQDKFTGPISQTFDDDFTGDGVPPEERNE